MVMVIMVIWGGYVITFFVHLVTLLMGGAGEFRWSSVTRRVCLLEARERGSRSYGAQGARTTSGRFVMRRGWFLLKNYVWERIELL
jgi:hypothetical protein